MSDLTDMNSIREASNDVYVYTLEHGGASFILQHAGAGQRDHGHGKLRATHRPIIAATAAWGAGRGF